MSRAHPEILKVLPHADQLGQTIKARIYYTDATPTADYTIHTWDARIGEVYQFQIGYADVAYPSKSVAWKIEIYLGTYASADDIITYLLHDEAAEYLTPIYYTNSLGGIDSIICHSAQRQPLHQLESITGVLQPDFSTNYRNQRQYRQLSATGRKGYRVMTGQLPGRAHLQALEELWLINHAWVYTTVGGQSRWLPIEILGSYTPPDDSDNRQSLTIEYLLSIDIRSISRAS